LSLELQPYRGKEVCWEASDAVDKERRMTAMGPCEKGTYQ